MNNWVEVLLLVASGVSIVLAYLVGYGQGYRDHREHMEILEEERDDN